MFALSYIKDSFASTPPPVLAVVSSAVVSPAVVSAPLAVESTKTSKVLSPLLEIVEEPLELSDEPEPKIPATTAAAAAASAAVAPPELSTFPVVSTFLATIPLISALL